MDASGNVLVVTPGMNSNVHESMGAMTDEAAYLRDIVDRHSRGTDLAVISWIGYEPPSQTGPDHEPIMNALWAGWEGDYRLTLAGHSYGSVTTASALQYLYEDGKTPVDATVVYGSPGLVDHDDDHALVITPNGPPVSVATPELSDMGLDSASSYYMVADDDDVPMLNSITDR